MEVAPARPDVTFELVAHPTSVRRPAPANSHRARRRPNAPAGGGPMSDVASTLGISDADFQSGKRTFTGNGASAAVSNAGLIAVGRGGYAALLGGSVSNAGRIIVPLGQVGLGSGESATLDFSGTEFQKKVWQALLAIPFGQTRSYGEIAKALGNAKAMRAVGAANGKNPISIIAPCHRVIGSTGKLTGFAGGLDVKARLLDLERSGVAFPPAIADTLFHVTGASQ